MRYKGGGTGGETKNGSSVRIFFSADQPHGYIPVSGVIFYYKGHFVPVKGTRGHAIIPVPADNRTLWCPVKLLFNPRKHRLCTFSGFQVFPLFYRFIRFRIPGRYCIMGERNRCFYLVRHTTVMFFKFLNEEGEGMCLGRNDTSRESAGL